MPSFHCSKLRFSDPLRAGLIEGGSAGSAPPSIRPRGFPAPCGPASLKDGGRHLPARGAHRFSGPLRAGLIEGGGFHAAALLPRLARFSGPLRAGLIEGPAGPTATEDPPVVFRPLAGRPH